MGGQAGAERVSLRLARRILVVARRETIGVRAGPVALLVLVAVARRRLAGRVFRRALRGLALLARLRRRVVGRVGAAGIGRHGAVGRLAALGRAGATFTGRVAR